MGLVSRAFGGVKFGKLWELCEENQEDNTLVMLIPAHIMYEFNV